MYVIEALKPNPNWYLLYFLDIFNAKRTCEYWISGFSTYCLDFVYLIRNLVEHRLLDLIGMALYVDSIFLAIDSEINFWF